MLRPFNSVPKETSGLLYQPYLDRNVGRHNGYHSFPFPSSKYTCSKIQSLARSVRLFHICLCHLLLRFEICLKISPLYTMNTCAKCARDGAIACLHHLLSQKLLKIHDQKDPRVTWSLLEIAAKARWMMVLKFERMNRNIYNSSYIILCHAEYHILRLFNLIVDD